MFLSPIDDVRPGELHDIAYNRLKKAVMDQQTTQQSCASSTSPNIARLDCCKREDLSPYSIQPPQPQKFLADNTICSHNQPSSKPFDTILNPTSMKILYNDWSHDPRQKVDGVNDHAQVNSACVPGQWSSTPFKQSNRGSTFTEAVMPANSYTSVPVDWSTFVKDNPYDTNYQTSSPHGYRLQTSAVGTPSSTGSYFWTQATTPTTSYTDNFGAGQVLDGIDAMSAGPGIDISLSHEHHPVGEGPNKCFWDSEYIPDATATILDLEKFTPNLPRFKTMANDDIRLPVSDSSLAVTRYCSQNNRSLPEQFTTERLDTKATLYPPLPELSPSNIFDATDDQWCDYMDSPSLLGPQDGSLNSALSQHDFYPHTAETNESTAVGYQLRSMSSTSGRRDASESSRSAAISRDAEKDAFLLDCKASGMSYKEIKVRGKFHEAESTLRGRYRTLTKTRDQRVRKPAWSSRDLMILKQSVAQHLRNTPAARHDEPPYSANTRTTMRQALSKVSWKRVAESMVEQGCYHYGNATVKKKYMHLMGLQ